MLFFNFHSMVHDKTGPDRKKLDRRNARQQPIKFKDSGFRTGKMLKKKINRIITPPSGRGLVIHFLFSFVFIIFFFFFIFFHGHLPHTAPVFARPNKYSWQIPIIRRWGQFNTLTSVIYKCSYCFRD